MSKPSMGKPGMTKLMTKSRLLPVGAALVLAGVATSWYFALDENEHAAAPSTAPTEHAEPAAAATAGETLTRPEWNARITATKTIEEQPPAQQRRYYETWIGALQRTQEAQRQSLEQLKARASSFEGDADARAALTARIGQIEVAMTERAQRIEQHSTAVAALR